MHILLAIAMGLAATDPAPNTKAHLALIPNATEILQADNLLVRAVLENPTDSDCTVFTLTTENTCRFVLQVHDGSDWVAVRTMDEEVIGIGFGGAGAMVIPPKSQFAEHNWYHRSAGEFVFGRAGEYRLRAVAKTSDGELRSEECAVTVGKRSDRDLQRVRDLGPALHGLETTLKWDTGEVLMSIQDVGGNIRATIRNRNLVREYLRGATIDGAAILPGQMSSVLQKRMDDVSYSAMLDQLAKYYTSKRDADGLARVLNALPYRSKGQIDGARQLKDFLKPK